MPYENSVFLYNLISGEINTLNVLVHSQIPIQFKTHTLDQIHEKHIPELIKKNCDNLTFFNAPYIFRYKNATRVFR